MENSDVLNLKQLFESLVEHIEKCSYCDGEGVELNDPTSACHVCGGQGKTLCATAYINGIEMYHQKYNKK